VPRRYRALVGRGEVWRSLDTCDWKIAVVRRKPGGVIPFTKEPMEFAAKPASKTVKASPLKVVKDAV
jgi:hypothetical protein